ncbi:MAG TPA: RidA family protein [Dehalococcoidia bacterium]|nr:RidA family protein [Dehalococcoidia bacterium]
MMVRRIVEVDGRVGQPNIPACVVLGNLILPSVISGRDPAASEQSDDPEIQIAQAFVNMKAVVEAAGGTLDGIGKVTVYLKDFSHRRYVNECWQAMFPDADNRPARHVLKAELQPGDWVQLDVIASL